MCTPEENFCLSVGKMRIGEKTKLCRGSVAVAGSFWIAAVSRYQEARGFLDILHFGIGN